tara:strand:- start:353 stop:745 length:393 start_codon:yes stop_codon:yes gene_type:complete
MKETPNDYFFYQASDITMLDGYAPPSDAVCMAFQKLPDEEVFDTVMMCLNVVIGENMAEKLTQEECTNLTVLAPILRAIQKTKIVDIQKVVDIPVQWLKRWNESLDLAHKTLTDEEIPTTDELNTLFEDS